MKRGKIFLLGFARKNFEAEGLACHVMDIHYSGYYSVQQLSDIGSKG